MVVNGFFGWINEVVADFLNSGLMLAGVSMMLMTPSSSGIQSVWEASAGIVNTSFVLIVTAAGVLVMGHQTVQTSTGIKEILPRLVLAFIAVNASWFLCQQLGLLASAVSVAILGDTADEGSVNQAMARVLSNPRDEGLITAGFMLMAAVAGVIFVFTVIIRLMLWILLTAAAPLALAAHALPQTQGLARLWWRAIGALLIMQVGQALVLRMVMTLFLEREGLSMFDPLGTAGSLIELQVLLACLYVLIRVPFWAGKQIFNPSASPLVKGAKLATSILLFKGLGVGKAAAGQKAGKALTSAKSGAVGQRIASARPPSGPAPRTPSTPGTPRWRQPELPGMRSRSSAGPGPATGRQKPVPGIDSQIDPGEQQRLRERRRWVQPPCPPDRRPARLTIGKTRCRGWKTHRVRTRTPSQGCRTQRKRAKSPCSSPPRVCAVRLPNAGAGFRSASTSPSGVVARRARQPGAARSHRATEAATQEGGSRCRVYGCPPMWNARTRSWPDSRCANY